MRAPRAGPARTASRWSATPIRTISAQLGRTYSLVDAPPDAAAICEAIRAGRVTLVTEPVPVFELPTCSRA